MSSRATTDGGWTRRLPKHRPRRDSPFSHRRPGHSAQVPRAADGGPAAAGGNRRQGRGRLRRNCRGGAPFGGAHLLKILFTQDRGRIGCQGSVGLQSGRAAGFCAGLAERLHCAARGGGIFFGRLVAAGKNIRRFFQRVGGAPKKLEGAGEGLPLAGRADKNRKQRPENIRAGMQSGFFQGQRRIPNCVRSGGNAHSPQQAGEAAEIVQQFSAVGRG